MTVRNAAGSLQSKTAVLALMTENTPNENKTYRFDGTEDLYQAETLPGKTTVDGDKQLAFVQGAQYTLSEINRLFPQAIITGITVKATGAAITSLPAAGGTVLRIAGDNLTGVTAVTFGGTAGTSVTVVSRYAVDVTTPAKAAGSYTIAITDDAGAVDDTDFPLTNAATYV